MLCKATTRAGEPCGNDAIQGGTVCRMHGGAAPKAKALAAVRHEVSQWTIGQAVDDPGEVLLKLVTQARVRADRYAALIEEKVARGQEEFGDDFTLETILVGDVWSSDEDGGSHKTGEYIRGLIQLEATERDRLAGFATKAVAAGLAERQVRLAERQGELLASLMKAVMNDPELGFTEDQRRAMPGVFRRHLSLVAG